MCLWKKGSERQKCEADGEASGVETRLGQDADRVDPISPSCLRVLDARNATDPAEIEGSHQSVSEAEPATCLDESNGSDHQGHEETKSSGRGSGRENQRYRGHEGEDQAPESDDLALPHLGVTDIAGPRNVIDGHAVTLALRGSVGELSETARVRMKCWWAVLGLNQ
jgi:hypothetical protein